MGANIKVAKTLVQTGIGSFKVISGHPAQGLQTEVIDVSDMSIATRMLKAPRPQLEGTEITMLCDFAGTLATVGAENTSLVITTTDSAGSAITNTVTGFVKSAIPQGIDVGGERRIVQEVVFVPDGAEGTITTTTTT
jgi:hypothetical protein